MMGTQLILLLLSVSASFPQSGQKDCKVVISDSSAALNALKPDTFTTYNLLPILPDSMTYDEFKYLQLKIDTEDKVWSLLLPGYIHYETYDSKNGTGVLILRMVGYGLIGYALYAGIPGSVSDISLSKVKLNLAILAAGAGMNFAGWLYDIVHGEYRLREKQLSILYRYRRTLEMEKNAP